MRPRSRLIIVALALSASSFAADARPEPWESIQATGGLAVGPAFSSPGGWLLVITANLSGLEAKTRQPTPKNSAIACRKTEAVVEGKSIYLTVISGLAGPRVGAVCPAARIERVEAGAYKVYYRGPGEKPVFLKEVEIGL